MKPQISIAVALAVSALALASPLQPTSQPVPPATVTLAWNGSASDTNPADPLNYVLEWGAASGVYTCATNVGTALSCTVSNLTPGTNWYFAVLALDTNTTLVSPFSNQTNFLPSIPPNSPVLTTLKVVAQ
jgi:hypothetical protein